MRLYSPHLLGLSCDDCEQYVAEVDGRQITGRFHSRGGRRLARPKGMKTPCAICPKCEGFDGKDRNPTNGRLAELSTKNMQTLDLYYQAEVLPGAFADADGITRENFGLIRRELRALEQQQSGAASRLLAVLTTRTAR